MIVYWLLFAIPALGAMFEGIRHRSQFLNPILFFLLALFLVMAFRETGGDYHRYILMLSSYNSEPLSRWILLTEPIYGYLNWQSLQFGWGIYGVNAACSLIFIGCLYKFALDEPKPILVIAAAIPYLVIVVAIGYTRQGTGVGLFMLGLTYLRRQNALAYLICCVCAIGFHTSAIILLPLVYFCFSFKNKFTAYIVGGVLLAAAIIGLVFFFQEKVNFYVSIYAESDHYQSSGAFQRSLLNGLAGLVFFIFWKNWKQIFGAEQYFFYLSILALISVPASLYQSTVVDRMGLYLLPFQVLVFSRLPLLQGNQKYIQLTTLTVISAYALVLFVWLHLGSFSKVLWLPYESLILGTVY